MERLQWQKVPDPVSRFAVKDVVSPHFGVVNLNMKLHSRISIALACVCGGSVAWIAPATLRAEPAPFMMQAMVAGKPIDGQPLKWDDQEMSLLGRDGALYEFKPADAKNAKRYGKGFVGYNSQELHAKLRSNSSRSFAWSSWLL